MSVIESTGRERPIRQEGDPSQTKSLEAAGHLIGAHWDFWLLGGATLLIIPAVMMMPDPWSPWVIGFGIFMANFINHPHFAHSYQIFYRSFARRVADPETCSRLRARYWVAGVAVPTLLATYLLVNFSTENLRALGLAGNLMAFLVGWHYVKQGYGMLIVQSVLKKSFFSEDEKRWLMLNAYALWLFAYAFLNWRGARSELWGVQYFVVPMPIEVVYTLLVLATVTTLRCCFVLVSKYRGTDAGVPVSGLVAYAVTLYIWLFASLEPVIIALVPALHSLQYLTVVWRFEWNYQAAQDESRKTGVLKRAFGESQGKRLARFVAVGLALGYLGFWWIPEQFRAASASDFVLQTPGVLLFLFWIFINVHHYFLDNVMWRKENPETSRFLFAALRPPEKKPAP